MRLREREKNRERERKKIEREREREREREGGGDNAMRDIMESRCDSMLQLDIGNEVFIHMQEQM